MNTQQEYIEKQKAHIAAAQKRIDDSAWMPEIPDEWHARVTAPIWQGLYIHIPFDRKMYQPVIEYMASKDFRLASDRTDESKLSWSDFWTAMTFIPADEPQYDYWMEHQIEVRFDPDMEGATCQRRVMGSVMKKESVYEFACAGADH